MPSSPKSDPHHVPPKGPRLLAALMTRRPGGSGACAAPRSKLPRAPCSSCLRLGVLGGTAYGVQSVPDTPAVLPHSPLLCGDRREQGGGRVRRREQCSGLFCRLSASFWDPPFHAPWPNRHSHSSQREEPPYLVLERKGKGYPRMPAALGHQPAVAGPHPWGCSSASRRQVAARRRARGDGQLVNNPQDPVPLGGDPPGWGWDPSMCARGRRCGGRSWAEEKGKEEKRAQYLVCGRVRLPKLLWL